jgi:hypothetical protein
MDVEIKTMNLSFCGEVAHNIVNKEAKEFILNQLKNKYNIGINDNRAFILNEKSVYFLEKTQHIMSIKSSGTNYLLYFTKINNVNYCFFIDRKIAPGYTVPRIISTKFQFSDSVFNDTLLDGELVKNNDNRWSFLITDMLICEGQKLEDNIISRFNRLYKLLGDSYKINKEFDICPLVVKRLFKYSDYDYLITQFIPSLSYKTKGIYFNTLNQKHANQLFLFPNEHRTKHKKEAPSRYQNSTILNVNDDGSRVSNSASNEASVDTSAPSSFIFKLAKTTTPEIYNLFCRDGNDLIKLEKPAYIHGIKSGRMIRNCLKSSTTAYFYCRFNTKESMWEPTSKADVTGDNYVSNKEKVI